MDNHKVITTYATVSDLTADMLNAARAGDWERLSALEHECAEHVQSLRDEETLIDLTPEQKQRKIEMIQKILADDKAIRSITEPWLEQLANLLSSNGAERKLSRSYGAMPPG